MVRSVGVVGLGIMGSAMARNLVDAGFKVFGCDPDAQAAERAKAAGVNVVADAAAVAAATHTIITSLPGPAAVMAVAAAIVKGAAGPCIVAEVSTLALDDKLAFAHFVLIKFVGI